MARLTSNFSININSNYTQASNAAIRSITWQQGWDSRSFYNEVRQHVLNNGTRGLGNLFRTIRHEMITYDAALDAVPSRLRDGRYDRIHTEVTDAVRTGIFQAFIHFLDRYHVSVLNDQANRIADLTNTNSDLTEENSVLNNQISLAIEAIEALLTAPGVDENSDDYQNAWAQYEQLTAMLNIGG